MLLDAGVGTVDGKRVRQRSLVEEGRRWASTETDKGQLRSSRGGLRRRRQRVRVDDRGFGRVRRRSRKVKVFLEDVGA
jgi:hypothetical protein